MSAYYNEHDPYAAQWLRNLIAAGHIAPGDVDERSIVDVRADDIRGYSQCHFFAGIGGWSVALRLAGWDDERPVWTGSCPCQPFSAAGKGKAGDDDRHLWPAWASLIAECRPGTIFGEQVEAAIGWGWLDLVFADLEAESYACGSAVLPACGVGAPHIRNRIWFVADADRGGRHGAGVHVSERGSQQAVSATTWTSAARGVADAERGAAERRRHNVAGTPRGVEGEARERQRLRTDVGPSGIASGLADAGCLREGRAASTRETQSRGAGGVADADGGHTSAERLQRGGEQRQQPQDGGAGGGLGDAGREGWEGRIRPSDVELQGGAGTIRPTPAPSLSGGLGDAALNGGGALFRQPSQGDRPQEPAGGSSVLGGFWSNAEWLPCSDGKARPIEPGSFPLAHGVLKRPSKLRAYGNAIVPQVAAEFVQAFLEAAP